MYQQKRMQANAAWAKRGIVLALVGVIALYLTACCAFYIKNIDLFEGTFFGRSSKLRGPELTEAEQDAIRDAEIRAETGRGMWNMMHRMAAQYEKNPTPQQISEIKEFYRLTAAWHPCHECREHFKRVLADHPVRADDNKELSLWLCEVHNIVNERLNKPLFPCNLDALKERWGSCGCFDNATSTTE